jgi:AraC-like DNA-binding protein
MEEQRLYENPTLTLTDLAGALGITTKQTSALVNQGFGMNFNDFVNHYRVEAVKERLARGEHEKFTLLGIALACGFNSKSTFNRVFKRDTSLTPGQYLAQLEKRSAKS